MRKTPKISIERLFGQELAQGWETNTRKVFTKFIAFASLLMTRLIFK